MKACELLADFNSKIMEVSEKTGFSNTFIRVFKKRMGITPAEFRKREYGPDMA